MLTLLSCAARFLSLPCWQPLLFQEKSKLRTPRLLIAPTWQRWSITFDLSDLLHAVLV